LKFFYLVIALLFLSPALSQVFKQPLSVQYAALSVYSRNFSDVFSATANQASLAQLKTGGFAVYGERRFLLEELDGYAAIVAVPTSSGVFGFEGDYFGTAAFNESQLGLAYARKLTGQIDIGAKFNYYTVRIPGYKTAAALNYEMGLIFHLTDKVHAGVHVYNPASSKLGSNGNEKLAFQYKGGIGYELSETIFFSTEMQKQQNQPVSIGAGMQMNLHKNIFFRTAISTLANNNNVSAGIQLKFARIDINVAYHPQLGFTPGLLLLVNFTKADKK
jgi:hypothetical protein